MYKRQVCYDIKELGKQLKKIGMLVVQDQVWNRVTINPVSYTHLGKPSPNQTTINNLTESQTKGVSGGPSAPYGRYGNIFLSQTEYDELQAEYPDRLERFIEEMSRYLAANGKSYQNYAAALRIWAGNDKKEALKRAYQTTHARRARVYEE